MKIRSGFVSNSSSSSFVVAWPFKPSTVEEMNEVLFGKQKQYPGYDEMFPVSNVSNYLLQNLKWGKRAARKRLTEDFESELYCLVREYAEHNDNSMTLTEFGIELTWKSSQNQIKEMVCCLWKRFPRTNWQKKIDALVLHYRQWNLVADQLGNALRALEKTLREQHNCAYDFNATKERRQEIAQLAQTHVYSNVGYQKLRKKLSLAFNRMHGSPKKIQAIKDSIVKGLVEIFFDNGGTKYSVIEIADDTRMGSAMEHGNLFNKLPHNRFSHH